MASLLCLYVLFFVFHFFSGAVLCYSPVKSLPGFHGPLPFELETGYVGVGETEDVQLFYYFIKSEGNPQKDPLILWFTGGPGCSALTGVVFEIGPLEFKIEKYNGSVPQLILNPYSWTKKSSIIFLDLPVGTGFSYARTPQALNSSDSGQVHHSHHFMRKWLMDHPEFISNPFYVGGDSYSGLVVPIVAYEILEGNERALPFINLQGYIVGNPYTIRNSSKNFEVPFAHRMTLISDELFESLTASCKGEYANIDPNNVECLRHYDTYTMCISQVHNGSILWPLCPEISDDVSARRSLLYGTHKLFPHPTPNYSFGCFAYKFSLSYYWANDNRVRKALRIHEGSIGEWVRCNKHLNYEHDIKSAVPYHAKLSSKGYRSLVYSGDHDMVVPHMDTEAWIKSLNYSIIHHWRPWFIAHQVAGYTRIYANNMTYATIKGGGHTAEYTRKECSIMFFRWIAGEFL